jgi:hypothetical protein
MAANAMAERQLLQSQVRVLHMALSCSVACFAGERRVFAFGQGLNVFGMALRASFPAGEDGRMTRKFAYGISPVKPHLAKGFRR